MFFGHHHAPRAEETTNFKVLYDADLIVNKLEQYQENPPTQKQLDRLPELFLTKSGAEQGMKVLGKYTREG
ncbi:MAG: hypothetical protein D3906_13405 [Candidatus Electrothrix sp. AUS1_2]|nr:hypothetical protein [Candidatus Electrothrix sp. AUS1_2]